MKKKSLLLVFALLLGTGLFPNSAIAGTTKALMRFPDIFGNKVVFVQGEDIWKVSATGGQAVRLTINDGSERFPKFSPDGLLIAFTGEYDGNSDVYVMDENGGNIKRLTFHPGQDEVVGWNSVKNKIIFSSSRNSYSRFTNLFMISPDGTGLERLPIHEIYQGSFSDDGKKIAYNKVSREFRTWKRYKGGTAQDIYVYDFVSKKNTKITEFKGTDRFPMWKGDKIYFLSDRDRFLNIYSYDTKTKAISQLTHHKDYDARRASIGMNKIVYELGGSLWAYNIDTNKTSQIPVSIGVDPAETRTHLRKVTNYITDIDVSPSGKRALISARGDVFTVPLKNGSIRNITETSSARDKNAVWSPNGKCIAWLSDKSGEYDVYVKDLTSNKETKLTAYKSGFRHSLSWSPDSKKLAFTDQALNLIVVDAKIGNEVKIDKAEYENIDVSQEKKPIFDYSWSPDSNFIAYAKMDENLVYHIYIYSFATGKHQDVSEGIFNDFSPVFTKDGKHLLFISKRIFNPTFCDFEWEMVYKNVAGIYAYTLQKDGEKLLPLRSDEEEFNKTTVEKTKIGNKAKKVNVVIDFKGLAKRIEALPVKAGNYRRLKTTDKGLFYFNKDKGDFNRFEFRVVNSMNLYFFDYKKRKENLVINLINQYKISADGSSVVYKKGNSVGIVKTSVKNSKGNSLNINNLKMWINPKEEWTQIFNEAWRLERDYYYTESMHGLNWNSMKEKYGKLIQYASCRQDVKYIIGELIGELNTSHTYIFGGDRQRKASRVNVGMLGVNWETEKNSDYYKFGKIFTVPNWSAGITPPLAGAGKNVKTGDYLLMLNGKKVTTAKSIYSYFQNLAGEQVVLTVNSKPTIEGARKVIVKPLRSERTLRYLDWVEHNRMVVDKASNGQIGYVHLPDTYMGSAVEFPKYFYAMARKKGVIVDGRYNGGGLDPNIFLKRLRRNPHSYWTRRYSHDQTAPVYAPKAHMVCLTNRQAGSGGDELPEEFQQFKMGPVIGTRTWGGLVGVSMFMQLIDNGGISAPDYRIYTEEGKWTVENVGVTPDIIVDMDPEEMQRGYDAQLQTGINYLLKKIKDKPISWPKHPKFPIDN